MTSNVIQKPSRIMGPVDYVVVRFPGNKFSGEIVPELARLEQNKTIRIIDIAFVMKDQKGNVLITEAKNLGGVEGDAFSAFAAKASEWFSIDDIEAIAVVLPNNSSAAILLYENTWAIHLKEGLLNSKAELVDMGRIPSEIVRSVEQKLIAQAGV
ncbi:MAG: DUF6325 family protein [Methanomicrobiales archaeon]|nr:DUF6325 family protein [Methanomicrobiales archaeon]